MKIMKKAVSLMAMSVVMMGLPCFAVKAKADGFENSNSIYLEKIGSYVSGYSNKDGGVTEIISYDTVKNQAWVVNGTTGKLDILDLDGVTNGISEKMPAKTLDIRTIVAQAVPAFAYGEIEDIFALAAQKKEKPFIIIRMENLHMQQVPTFQPL